MSSRHSLHYNNIAYYRSIVKNILWRFGQGGFAFTDKDPRHCCVGLYVSHYKTVNCYSEQLFEYSVSHTKKETVATEFPVSWCPYSHEVTRPITQCLSVTFPNGHIQTSLPTSHLTPTYSIHIGRNKRAFESCKSWQPKTVKNPHMKLVRKTFPIMNSENKTLVLQYVVEVKKIK